VNEEPLIDVGIAIERGEIRGRINGSFCCGGVMVTEEDFVARALGQSIVIAFGSGREVVQESPVIIDPVPESTFTLFDITIGHQFHWERPEDQEFKGTLVLICSSGTVTAVNRVPAELYLQSVISSEMSARSPVEFLKAHAILSRSWLFSSIAKKEKKATAPSAALPPTEGEILRWYDREDHDGFDVCSDDHCQRYHGVTKITSSEAKRAVEGTRGTVLTYEGDICDARYSKACGGLTEVFSTAWESDEVPYLKSVVDGNDRVRPLSSEEDAQEWILSNPDAFCNVDDPELLSTILPDFDRETRAFFRWTVEYGAEELSLLICEKSGIDFGEIREILPLTRGPSGRIFRLKIAGTKNSVIIGKELEIRRWLSKSHLFSSAFVVQTKRDGNGRSESFIFHGAGWGHGVGLCQIGAAAMAQEGFPAEAILKHYFVGAELSRIYQ
jgi:stage II sporulation protein D